MKSMIFALVISLIPLSSFASFTKGNGGNILVCSNDQNIVLDFYEMKEWHGFKLNADLITSSTFPLDIARNIAKIDADLSISFLEHFNRINNAKLFLKTSSLGVIDDVFDVFIPENCELAQTIIQRNGKLLISQTLFETLAPLQQEILILHEAIYSMLLAKNPLNDSRPVRSLVALLISENLKSMSPQEIKLFLAKHKI